MSFLHRVVQASTDMSSLRRYVGKGMGFIAVEAVIHDFCRFVSPPIDSRSHTFPRWNDIVGGKTHH